jgi:OOP family OmpA-OmpF porin
MSRLFMVGLFAAVVGCKLPSTDLSSNNPPVTATPASSEAPKPKPVDGDGDRLLGEADGCPDMPEDADGEADDDGCPDLACRLEPCHIALLQPVHFEYGSLEVDERSQQMLEDVAWLMNVKPEITVDIVDSYSESAPQAPPKSKYARRRAESVVRRLIEHGVAPERMTSRSGGYADPADPNTTAQGLLEIKRTDNEDCR